MNVSEPVHLAMCDPWGQANWAELVTLEAKGTKLQTSKACGKTAGKLESYSFLGCTVKELKSSGYKVKKERLQLDVWKTISLWSQLSIGTRGPRPGGSIFGGFQELIEQSPEQPGLNLVYDCSLSSPFQYSCIYTLAHCHDIGTLKQVFQCGLSA